MSIHPSRTAALLASLSILSAALSCRQVVGASEEARPTAAGPGAFKATTKVTIVNSAWHLNGKKTHQGNRAEGLLLNVRMVNCTFEDRNPATCPKDFDPAKNTEAFVARIPEYVAQGVCGFGLCLQGGACGYDGAVNSAYEPGGSLRPDYMKRVARVIEACDKAGAVVMLCCFYQQQDQILKDEAAVKDAVVNTASWIRDQGYTNLCLEIANEHAHKGFDHVTIREPGGIRELMGLAKKTCPGLLVSASGMGGGRLAHEIAIVADFILLHFNSVPVDEILERVASADKVSKAIVCNEDPRVGAEGAKALEASVNAFCSWGFANLKKNQYYPFKFEGAADDPAVYAKFKELTSPEK